MRYYKCVENGYIVYISTGAGQTEICKEEYEEILNVVNNKPQAPEGYGYMLKTDLTFELVKQDIPEVEFEENL